MRKASPTASKLARRAARGGYFRTAHKQLALLRAEQGLSVETFYATTVVFWRRLVSLGRARRPPDYVFPDVCTWDCCAQSNAGADLRFDREAA